MRPLPGPVGEQDTVYGHEFTWTDDHPGEADIAHLLYSYDELATTALDRLDEIAPPQTKGWRCPGAEGPGQRDLYALLEEHASEDPVLSKLWAEITTVPEWVDWDQIARGQRLLYQYNGQILLGLLFRSLLGGMGLPRIVETLSRTGGFGVQVCRRRLLETLQHFLSVTSTLASIQPHGDGFTSTVRVRLLHASVRRRLTELEAARPGYFPVSTLGVPINDLHSIGTVSAYSTAIMYMALPRLGVVLADEEVDDYLALWRWVGHLLGTPTEWMADRAKAKAMLESVMVAEMQPSANSRILANNILTAMSNVPPFNTSRELLAAQAYRMNGDHLAGALGIEKPSWPWRLLVWIQFMILFLFSWSYPWLPTAMQNRRDERFRNLCKEMILNHKLGGIGSPARFDFQYLPNHGQMTELGVLQSAVDTVQAASKRHGPFLGFLKVLAGGLLALGVLRLGIRGGMHTVPTHLIGMLVSQ